MPVRLSRRRLLAILGGAVALGTALGSLKVFELASHQVEQLRVEDETCRSQRFNAIVLRLELGLPSPLSRLLF